MKKKILIIEDYADNLELFSTILRYDGYETLEAKNSLEGIRLAQTGRPHLILMDIPMFADDGIEAVKIMKSHPLTKDIPCIALTSYITWGTRKRFLNLGFVDYIVKPIFLREFLRVIAAHIDIGRSIA